MGETKPADILQGTLELLILRTLASGEKHGYEIAEAVDDLETAQPGSAGEAIRL